MDPKHKTVHCPRGITERDVWTFFTKVQSNGTCGWQEARAVVSFLKRHDEDTWRNATLTVYGRFDTICFISGRGSSEFCVRLEKHEKGIRASLENLLLGFFRLGVAVATLGQGSVVAVWLFLGQAVNMNTTLDITWAGLIYARDILTLSASVVAAADTVFGPKTLFGGWTTEESLSVEEAASVPAQTVLNQNAVESRTGQHKRGQKTESKLPTVSTTISSQDNSHESPKTNEEHGEMNECILHGRYKWLLRAWLYWFIASSPRPRDTSTVHTDTTVFDESGIAALVSVPGFLLFWAGVLSILTHGLLTFFPFLLVTPWAGISQQNAAEGSVRNRKSDSKHCGKRFLKSVPAILSALLLLIFCAFHTITLTYTVNAENHPQLEDAHQGRLHSNSNFKVKLEEGVVNLARSLIPAMSSIVVCAHFLLWSAVDFVGIWRSCGSCEKPLCWTRTVMLVCNASILWAGGTVQALETVSENKYGLDGKAAIIVLSSAALVVAVFQQLLQRLTPACVASLKGCVTKPCEKCAAKYWSSRLGFSKTSDILSRCVYAVAVLLATYSLGLAVFAMPLPWLRVRTSYSHDFWPMTAALRNVSIHMAYHALAMDALVNFPVCQEDTVSVLRADVSRSQHLLSRISVDQIEKFCMQDECQDHSTSKSNQHSFSDNEERQTGAALCEKYCFTLEFFRGNVAFNTTVHQPIAREVKGNAMYEMLHLKSIILEGKSKLLTQLQDHAIFGEILWTGLQGTEKPVQSQQNVGAAPVFQQSSDLSRRPKSSSRRQTSGAPPTVQPHANIQEHTLSASKQNVETGLKDAKTYGQPQQNVGAAPTFQRPADISRDSPSADISRYHHSACREALCALRAISSAGLAAPLLGFAFYAMHVAVQAMLLLLELAMRAQEMRVVFDDFKLRLDALVLYLQHGTEERIITFSIYNYSLIYVSYPILLTGCVGVLAGFWHRCGAGLGHTRRCRSTLVVVLPLMVLNIFGLLLTVAWTYVVESFSSLVNLVDVTSSPESGARVLMAAFVCGTCSCAMFLALEHLQSTRRRTTVSGLQSTDNCIQGTSDGCPKSDRNRSRETPPCAITYPKFRGLCCGSSHRLSAAGPWLLGVLLACFGGLLMFLCLRVPVFNAQVNLRQDFEALIAELSQGGTAVEVGRRVLLSRDESCDVIHLVGREVLMNYFNTLEEVKVEALIIELNVLRAKARVNADTVLPLVTIPCVVSSLLSCGLVVYGALSAILPKPDSKWILSSKGASKAVHRLTLLSLAWLLHASLAMTGPAGNTALPALVEMHVQLTIGFAMALGSHILLLLGMLKCWRLTWAMVTAFLQKPPDREVNPLVWMVV